MENKSPVAQAWEWRSHITGAEWAGLEGPPGSRPAVMGPGWEAAAPWSQTLQGVSLSWPPFQLHRGPIPKPEWNRRPINNHPWAVDAMHESNNIMRGFIHPARWPAFPFCYSHHLNRIRESKIL